MANVIHNWVRYWTTPDGQISLGDQGFLVPPNHEGWLGAASADLWAFEQIAERRCLVLLGEPGMGKSETLRAEAEALRARGEAVLQVDLGATREESVLAQEIFGSVEFCTWAEGAGELHLFLDSLDEAVIRLGVVGDVLLKGLRRADTSRLWLRLACRTADRLREFEAQLKALWREHESGDYELAPLTRADVELAAGDCGLDPKAFVRDLVERDIVGLAIKPVTLNMLLDLANDHGRLPRSQLEVYERGLLRLVTEPAERRDRDPATKGRLSPGERLAVARRIAGATILTGRTAIRTDDSARPSADVVTVAQLAGGTEVNFELAVPTRFDVSEDAVREVLNTGLFSARGEDLGWAHQTYGECLAAGYLTSTDMPIGQQLTLLVADVDDQRIVPQLRDVAAWAAAMDPEITDALAAREPLVLLRGDVALTDDDRKARIVEALLQEHVAQEVDNWDPRVRRNMAALKHDGLAQTLRAHLAKRDAPLRVRQLACVLAGLWDVRELNPDLLKLAVADDEPIALRVAAVDALETTADEESRERLVPLARDPLPEDSDDDLKGIALRVVCPTVVDAVATLPSLTPPKNPHYLGSYATFLSRHLPEAITDDELGSAMAWVRSVPDLRYRTDELGGLAERILVRAVAKIDRDDVREPLVETVTDYINDHHELQTFRTRETSDVFTAARTRHCLIEALVPMIRDGRLDAGGLVTSQPRLITGADLPWLIERLHDSQDARDEAVWVELIEWAMHFEGADQDLVMDARETDQLLYERTRSRYGPVALDSDMAQAMRDRYAREQEWAEEQRRAEAEAPDWDANIGLLLDRFESGDLDAFWQMMIHMRGEPGEQVTRRSGSSDLTSTPGWQRADEARRARISAAAERYLREYEPSDSWLDPARRYRPATAGYCALRHVAEHLPGGLGSLDDATLCRWAPAVLAFTDDPGVKDEQKARNALLQALRDRCPTRLAESATKLVMAESAHGDGHLFSLYSLRSVMSNGLGAALRDLWRTTNLRPEPAAQLLKALLQAGVSGAEEEGLAAVKPELVKSDPVRSRALAGALLGSGTPGVWPHIKALVFEHPDWGRAVFEDLADNWDRQGDFRVDLVEPELAELFIWLSEQFPRDQDPERIGAHYVGTREAVADYRDQILSVLAHRGTASSLMALDHIEQSTGVPFAYVRRQAEEARRRNSWNPPRPEDVIRLAADARRRIVLSGGDVQRVVIEALERIQRKLADEGQAHQVWDTASGRPKREPEVAKWIADRLGEDLKGRGIIVNREVEVRLNPRGGVGDRTDIHVDAIAGERVEGASQITVVIEVKGCWHDQLLTAMRSQLAKQYLSPGGDCSHGIYLPVWFGPTGWQDEDRRRDACSKHEPRELEATLQQQAKTLRKDGYHVRVVVLDASLR